MSPSASSVPPADMVGRVEGADEMADLLQRQDLPVDKPSWWTAVISRCNSGMLGAEAGAVDAEQWANLLIQTLERADKLGVLQREETFHRRMIACAAALRYFGVRRGDPLRDPVLIFAWLRGVLGDSPDALLEECQRIARVPREERIGKDLYKGIRWLVSVKMGLEALCDVVEYAPDGLEKAEMGKWCGTATSIPTRRA